jgi:hypothetical protein
VAKPSKTSIIIVAALIIVGILACPPTWLLVGTFYVDKVAPPMQPPDASASVSEQISKLYDDRVEDVVVKHIKKTSEQTDGDVWGYDGTWRLSQTDVVVKAWIPAATVEAIAAKHPAFPESTGMSPVGFSEIARVWEKGSGEKTMNGIWKARSYGLNGELKPAFKNYRYQDCFVVAIYEGDFAPPSQNADGVSKGWVVYLDKLTGKTKYLGTVDDVISYETRKRRF